MRYDIELRDPAVDFVRCWQAAGRHLDRCVQDGIKSWLRAHTKPPFLEHLSFRLGNQLFFVRIIDVDDRLEIPGSMKGLFTISDGCKGNACLMPMQLESTGVWRPVQPGWGLVNARTGDLIDVLNLVTDEKVEMTSWEVHDLAVQIVREQMGSWGCEVTLWQGNPDIDPAIWFTRDGQELEWVLVRAARYPAKPPPRPENSKEIADDCAHMGKRGHFASVVVASEDESFNPEGADPSPLWRGHGCIVKFDGIVEL